MLGVTATFHGHYTTGYLQYIDLSTYHTLVAVPGNTYDIVVASGWENQLAAPPTDGQWTAAAPFPAQFSGVPGFASPGAFIPGSPGTPQQSDSAMLDVFRVARAEELRRSEEAEETRLLAAGWTGEELGLRRAGWAAGDIRRQRQRRHLLEMAGRSR